MAFKAPKKNPTGTPKYKPITKTIGPVADFLAKPPMGGNFMPPGGMPPPMAGPPMRKAKRGRYG